MFLQDVEMNIWNGGNATFCYKSNRYVENTFAFSRVFIYSIKQLDQDIFDSYMQRAKYYGYDLTYCVYVNRHMVSNGLNHKLPIVDQRTRSPSNICFEPDDLQTLLKAKGVMQVNCETPLTKEIELLKLRLRGLGNCTEDSMAAGDLHIRIIYRP